ncbi:MAG TPA: hypothetical protein VNM15_10785, partial [Candidatus Binatia bacterium]|nr:hypothetical protein [Candidatus Binatia bacterium]
MDPVSKWGGLKNKKKDDAGKGESRDQSNKEASTEAGPCGHGKTIHAEKLTGNKRCGGGLTLPVVPPYRWRVVLCAVLARPCGLELKTG